MQKKFGNVMAKQKEDNATGERVTKKDLNEKIEELQHLKSRYSKEVASNPK